MDWLKAFRRPSKEPGTVGYSFGNLGITNLEELWPLGLRVEGLVNHSEPEVCLLGYIWLSFKDRGAAETFQLLTGLEPDGLQGSC